MSKQFYTNVTQMGNRILHKYIDEYGNRQEYFGHSEVDLFVQNKELSDYKDVTGLPLSIMEFTRIADAKAFATQYKDIPNFKIHGNQNYWAQFIANEYPNVIEYDQDKITIANIDIEVKMGENGFPHAYLAESEITAITVGVNHKYVVFGCKDFDNTADDVRYVKCKNEKDLIWEFLSFWDALNPDVITGWNTSTFDIPYLVNRIEKILGEKFVCYMSPMGRKYAKQFAVNQSHNTEGKRVEYDLAGIAHLDYLKLYRKFTFKERERYSLDFIAYVELKKRKLDYSEYGNLDDLYKKNYQKYIEYNIRDVKLVDELDDKLNLVMLALNLAYKSKIPLDSVFSQVRMWDSYIYNELRADKIVVPPKQSFTKNEKYAGAVVFDPVLGKHKWVVAFDLDGLYPHLIMQYGISPEVIINKSDLLSRRTGKELKWIDILLGYWDDSKGKLDVKVSMFVGGQNHEILDAIKVLNINMTANGALFDGRREPILPKMMLRLYNERKGIKQNQLSAESKVEEFKHELALFEKGESALYSDVSGYESQIKHYQDIAKKCKVMQMGIKVFLNSAYGMIGNEFSRYYDVRIAEGITLSGQLSIQWIKRKLNEYLNHVMHTKGLDYIIAGDTDSVYITLNKAVEKLMPNGTPLEIVELLDTLCEKSIQPFVTKSYNELADYMNAREQKMNMTREVIASTGIWRAKKNYALDVYNNEGVQYDKPKLKVVGLESVRSSTPEICRDAFEDSIKHILRKDESTLQAHVKEFKSKFYDAPVDDICKPSGINDIDKWYCATGFISRTPVHVKASMTYNRMIKKLGLERKYRLIQNGDKVKWVYLKPANPTFSNAIAFPDVLPPEFELDNYIDKKLQFEKTFNNPVDSLCVLTDWSSKHIGRLF